ncbi:MAG: DegT/DnrJ/EryC1/StrS family aminotransferase [Syntrophobacterales bacterium CG_4_8_14_3_um_filter_58_8]|nr:MAG: DegT/DnrJ/EryC1/StrS family aminotransferase [Syntrophobacterales bacterium CG03_land_8_20_14_0_80_58_14]PJC72795.1 MAG: DegT/DnrJ/EryC1/StrS family aminotransferase [Syntrophobacterales bacterium CG_4_8_14_3_um_filter_58_8]
MAGAELIGKEEIKEVMDVLKTGVFARYAFDNERQGIWKVRDFEKAFARYAGSQYALGVTSGSAALKIALTALDVGPGDEVICPAFTFMATYEAVLEVGAIPVMADIDDTLNLDPDDIPNKLTPRTKAVIPVHMCGAPARIDRIMKVAKKHKLLVLEDTAQGLGASFKGKKLGSFGHMGIFSFDHYKTITTGEGGMVITNDLDLYHRAEWYHDHGHDHLSPVSRALDGRTILGFNYRMNELQGALGLAQLRKLGRVIAAQRKNQAVVMEALAGLPGIKFRGMPDPEGDSATFLAFNLPEEEQTKTFQKALKAEGQDTVRFKDNFWHYVPNWEHFLAKSTANSLKNPFSDRRNRKPIYSRKAIPHAEDLLGRTLIMGISVKMPAAKMKAIRTAIANAAKVL